MALTQVPIELSSTPGIVDNSNDTAITIDSSENVLVGKTSLAIANEGIVFEKGGAAEFTTDASRVMRLNRTSDDGSVLEINKDGTTVGSIGVEGGDSLYIQAGTTSGAGLHMHPTGGTVRPARNGATIDNTIDLGTSTRRFKDLYLSGRAYINDGIKLDSGDGIYFGQDGTSANKLDDYEEGTWNPSIIGSTTAGSYSGVERSGTYTKVGNLVTATFAFYGTSGTGAGNLNISGFPFTHAAGNTCVHTLQYNFGLTLPTGTGVPMLYIATNGTTGEIRCNSDSVGSFARMTYPTTAGYVRGTITYITS